MITFELFRKGASKPHTQKITLLNAVTATGAGDYCDFEQLLSRFSCIVRWGGTVPTNTVVRLEGSLDRTNWATLAEVTVTSDKWMFHVIDKPVPFVRGNYVSKSGGDGTTSVTLEMVAGGN